MSLGKNLRDINYNKIKEKFYYFGNGLECPQTYVFEKENSSHIVIPNSNLSKLLLDWAKNLDRVDYTRMLTK